MKVRMPLALVLGFLTACTVMAGLEATGDGARLKIDQWVDTAKKIAAAPELIKAVAAQNQQLPAEYADMSQVKWAALADLDPLVTALSKNAAAKRLRAHKVAGLAELFVSDKQGRKVAFLSKPTNWSHEGKAKHEQPMAGKIWEGRVEYDQSTRLVQVQIAVPVLQDGKPIGSLVIGVEWEWLEKM